MHSVRSALVLARRNVISKPFAYAKFFSAHMMRSSTLARGLTLGGNKPADKRVRTVVCKENLKKVTVAPSPSGRLAPNHMRRARASKRTNVATLQTH
jgi:hypothetical protein